MALNSIVAVGLVAGFLTTVAYAPQVIKAFRTKSTKDLSLAWLSTAFAGQGLWVAYGVFIGSLPIVIWNTCGNVLILALIILKIIHG